MPFKREYDDLTDEMELGRKKAPDSESRRSHHVPWDSGNVSQFSIQPMVPETSVAIESPQSVKPLYSKGYHAFAFAWFQVPEDLDESKEDGVKSGRSQSLLSTVYASRDMYATLNHESTANLHRYPGWVQRMEI